jgi:uncharacterized protein
MATTLSTRSDVDPEMLLACEERPGTRAAPGWYVIAGIALGILFIKSEVLTWYRIQEMFRLQAFHMYGVIGTALAVALPAVQLIRRLKLRAWNGEVIVIPDKHLTDYGVRYWAGGTVFGLGWALLGACPGPMFALLGAGVTVMVAAIASAMAGTWAYAALQSRLPH